MYSSIYQAHVRRLHEGYCEWCQKSVKLCDVCHEVFDGSGSGSHEEFENGEIHHIHSDRDCDEVFMESYSEIGFCQGFPMDDKEMADLHRHEVFASGV